MFYVILFQVILVVFIAFNIFILALLFPIERTSKKKSKVKKA